MSRDPAGLEGTSEANPSEVNHNWVRLALSGSVRSDERACSYSAFLLSYLDEMSDADLKTSADEQFQNYQAWLASEANEPISKQVRRLRQRMLDDLEVMTHAQDRRTLLQKSFSSICTAGRTVGGTALKETALTASLAVSALTLPIRFVAKFGIGTFTRKKSKHRGAGFAEITGSKAGFGNWLGVAYQGIRVAAFSGNPYLLGIYALTATDLEAQILCRSNDTKSPRTQDFCNRYESLKKGEYEATQVGEKLGIQFRGKMLHLFDFRSDDRLNEKICEKGIAKQIRVGKRAKERLDADLAAQGITSGEVQVLAPDVGGCVSLRILNLSKIDFDRLSAQHEQIKDGLAYTIAMAPPSPSIEATQKTPAPEAPPPDFSKAEDVCRAVHIQKVLAVVNRSESIDQKMNILGVQANPKRFTKPQLRPVEVPAAHMVGTHSEILATGRNLILIMAPSEEQEAEFEALEPYYEDLKAQVDAERTKLKYLVKAKDYEECLARQEEIEFDYKGFSELNNSIQQFQVAQRIQEYEAMKKKVEQAGHSFMGYRLKLNWEVRDLKDLNDVRKVLQDPSVANLVLVSHGDPAGKIIDSRFNELPSIAFQEITPNLQSLNFFSCHSAKSAGSYEIEKAFSSQQSFHQVRYVGDVISSDLLEELNIAPVMGLKDYVESLDQKLYSALMGNVDVQMAHSKEMKAWERPKNCRIHFEGLHLKKGSFAIQVGQGWGGMISAGEEAQYRSVPCDELQAKPGEGPVRLYLINVNLVQKAVIENKQVKLIVQGTHGAVKNYQPVEARPAELGNDAKGFVRMRWDLN